MSSPRRKSGGC